MRKAFINALSNLAAKNKNIYLLTGDLGFSVFEDFMKDYPGQYLNCGVAEQNMVGMAAGLAMSGKKVFVYSIIPFVTMRPFEQIRNDVCAQNLDVKIVGVGGGYSYGQLGATHHSLEDVAIMKALPNMKVLVPSDPIETELAVKAITEDSGPAYLRLGKSKEEKLHDSPFDMKISKSNVLKEGKNLTIMGIGPVLLNALRAADILAQENIDCKVVSMMSVKPIDKEEIIKDVKMGPIITLEEHNIIGGLGDSVGSVVAESGLRCRFKKIGVEDRFMKIVGDQEFLRAENGLSPEKIAETILKFFNS